MIITPLVVLFTSNGDLVKLQVCSNLQDAPRSSILLQSTKLQVRERDQGRKDYGKEEREELGMVLTRPKVAGGGWPATWRRERWWWWLMEAREKRV